MAPASRLAKLSFAHWVPKQELGNQRKGLSTLNLMAVAQRVETRIL